jgi:uncharacterized protein (TIGR04222 family)
MNPFDLPGPQFLQFYMFLGCVVLTALYYTQRISESGSIPRLDYSDPYLIAYLRGGEQEAARVAIISLVDRGLLRLLGDRLEVTGDATAVRRPIEKAILTRAKISKNVEGLLESASIKAGCKEYLDKLQQLRLLPDKAIEDARTNRLLLALVVLFGVAFIKIIVATMRGRQNIWYLVILAAVFGFFAIKNYNPTRTVLGNTMLADLRTLFASLKARSATIQSGGATGEAALLLAVFGAGALPASRFPIIQHFEKKRSLTGTSCSTSGCGSSCSSSSCGGGGGGGCGGCGGS